MTFTFTASANISADDLKDPVLCGETENYMRRNPGDRLPRMSAKKLAAVQASASDYKMKQAVARGVESLTKSIDNEFLSRVFSPIYPSEDCPEIV